MSEEEIKKFKEEILLNRECSGESNYIFVDDEEILELINLIEKQQKEIENSVSKDKIEEYLKEAEEKYQVYKKGVKDNEALKSGMWKHLGEVDVLKRILGKQRDVVTLDNKLLGE